VLQPKSNQIRAAGLRRSQPPRLERCVRVSYDIRQRFLQNQLVPGELYGAAAHRLGVRRLALGPVRSENQFRVALIIANIGTFGTCAPGEDFLSMVPTI